MSIAVAERKAPDTAGFAEKLSLDLLQVWSRACDEFRERERREIIEVEPTPEKLADHLKDLKAMIRLTTFLLGQVSDPDFPARHFLKEVKGRLLQLEDSWELLTNPMTDQEADALLEKCFPQNASGA